MERFSLELTLTVTEGSIHNLGHLRCLAWICASTYNPLHQDRGKAVVLAQTDDRASPWAAKELEISTIALGELVTLMKYLDLPDRTPDVHAKGGNPSAWQSIMLDLFLNGRQGRISLALLAGGLEGQDADLMGQLLGQLFTLLEVPFLQPWIRTD